MGPQRCPSLDLIAGHGPDSGRLARAVPCSATATTGGVLPPWLPSITRPTSTGIPRPGRRTHPYSTRSSKSCTPDGCSIPGSRHHGRSPAGQPRATATPNRGARRRPYHRQQPQAPVTDRSLRVAWLLARRMAPPGRRGAQQAAPVTPSRFLPSSP